MRGITLLNVMIIISAILLIILPVAVNFSAKQREVEWQRYSGEHHCKRESSDFHEFIFLTWMNEHYVCDGGERVTRTN